jgi:hypothetical protein
MDPQDHRVPLVHPARVAELPPPALRAPVVRPQLAVRRVRVVHRVPLVPRVARHAPVAVPVVAERRCR